MVDLSQQGALTESFQETGLPPASALDMAAYDGTRNHLQELTEEGNRRAIQVLIGMGTANELGGGLRPAEAAQAAMRRNETAEKEEKERAKDSFLLALLANGDLDLWVAENIFGSMNDEEVMDLVSIIESETGMSFEDYARNILGDDMPERRPGESDADYNRRVLTAVGDVVLEDDLSIRPGFENDPLARFIQGHEITKNTREAISNLDEQATVHGAKAVIHKAQEYAAGSVINAAVMDAESETQEFRTVGQGEYDTTTEDDLNGAHATQASAGILGGFSAVSEPPEQVTTALVGGDGRLEEASKDFGRQFPLASFDPRVAPDNEELPAPDRDLTQPPGVTGVG